MLEFISPEPPSTNKNPSREQQNHKLKPTLELKKTLYLLFDKQEFIKRTTKS